MKGGTDLLELHTTSVEQGVCSCSRVIFNSSEEAIQFCFERVDEFPSLSGVGDRIFSDAQVAWEIVKQQRTI